MTAQIARNLVPILSMLACGACFGTQTVRSNASAEASAADVSAKLQCRNALGAPESFVNGMSQAYASAYRDLTATPGETGASVAAKEIVQGKQDALFIYGVPAEDATSRLRSVYALAISHGMHESSGNPTEGADCTNKPDSSYRPCSYYRQPTHSSRAEAGLFQASADSLRSHRILRALWKSYDAHTDRCLADVFGSGLPNLKREEFGEGEVKEFQVFTKSCPAFAVEYEAVMLRVNAQHFGPVSRKEARIESSCVEMLRQTESSPRATGAGHPEH